MANKIRQAQIQDIIDLVTESEKLWDQVSDEIPDSYGDADFWDEVREIGRALPQARLNLESVQEKV